MFKTFVLTVTEFRVENVSNRKRSNSTFELVRISKIRFAQKFKSIFLSGTGQSIASLGKFPIEILSGKLHTTWVLAVLLFPAEFQSEPFRVKIFFDLYIRYTIDTVKNWSLFLYQTKSKIQFKHQSLRNLNTESNLILVLFVLWRFLFLI